MTKKDNTIKPSIKPSIEMSVGNATGQVPPTPTGAQPQLGIMPPVLEHLANYPYPLNIPSEGWSQVDATTDAAFRHVLETAHEALVHPGQVNVYTFSPDGFKECLSCVYAVRGPEHIELYMRHKHTTALAAAVTEALRVRQARESAVESIQLAVVELTDPPPTQR